MPQASVNQLTIEYETFGRSRNPCVLLIMGLGTQLTAWPTSLCKDLAARGFYVVRYDNRDVGLSSSLDNKKAPPLLLLGILSSLGIRLPVPYSLEDMASDAVGLLDALGIEQAHLVGASMGGMIAQRVAGQYPERTLSLTSIMSTTGHRSLPRASGKAMRALFMKPKDPQDLNSIIARNVAVRQILQSPDYPQTEAEHAAATKRDLERAGYQPAGVASQLAAVMTSGHTRKLLRRVTVPALVIHGADDPLVKLACGADTAKYLTQGRLVTFEGMGHDFPEALMTEWAQLIAETAAKAVKGKSGKVGTRKAA